MSWLLWCRWTEGWNELRSGGWADGWRCAQKNYDWGKSASNYECAGSWRQELADAAKEAYRGSLDALEGMDVLLGRHPAAPVEQYSKTAEIYFETFGTRLVWLVWAAGCGDGVGFRSFTIRPNNELVVYSGGRASESCAYRIYTASGRVNSQLIATNCYQTK